MAAALVAIQHPCQQEHRCGRHMPASCTCSSSHFMIFLPGDLQQTKEVIPQNSKLIDIYLHYRRYLLPPFHIT